MLKSLGLKSTLITDGKTPINLFNTAQGLIGGALTGQDIPTTALAKHSDDVE